MKESLVSCILTTYNRAHLVKRALESMLNQSYEAIEVIVVDDCSVDNTKNIITSYNDSRVKYFKHKRNMGLPQARNTGMQYATGAYLAFLDDDDEWLPKKIECQINVFRKSDLRNLGMVSCGIRRITNNHEVEQRESLRGEVLTACIIDQPFVGNGSCVVIKKEVYERHGGFDPRYKRGIDGYFFTKVARNYQIDFSDSVLVNYYEDAANRITDYQSVSKVEQAIQADFLLLQSVSDIIDRYPRKKAELSFRIGNNYVLLGDYKNSCKYYFRSLGARLNFKKYLLIFLYLLLPGVITKKLRIRRGLG